jgi:hypothetical protein
MPERRVPFLAILGTLLLAACVAVFLASHSWRAVAVLMALTVALAPAAFALQTAPSDEDDWWNPIWTAPPIVGIYVLACIVLTAAYSRRSNLSDVAIVLSGIVVASLVGSFFGFIFAIPRSLQHSGATANDDDPFYAPNTNLEQISDWLTKIIVGISLVEYSQIVSAFDRAVYWMSLSLGQTRELFFAGAILLSYAVAGFFCAYIWTRLRFTRDLTSLERVVRDSGEYLEGLANAYLYQPAPLGYTKSLKLSERYLRRFGRDNDRVWLYVACACGQMHRDLSLQYGESPAKEQLSELSGLEERALQALARVRDLAPGQFNIAYSLWDPDDSSEDGEDLRSFFGIQKFRDFFDRWNLDSRLRDHEAEINNEGPKKSA